MLSPDERAEFFGAIRDAQFREFVTAMLETGCRPGEMARVTAGNVDLDAGLWAFDRHKTADKTTRPRVTQDRPRATAAAGKACRE